MKLPYEVSIKMEIEAESPQEALRAFWEHVDNPHVKMEPEVRELVPINQKEK